jgi:endonuclease YncB( thermonuclease family)
MLWMRLVWLPLVLALWPLQAGTSVPPLTGQVVRVIDGDTLDLDGQRIRLHGIDAPEARETCRDARGGRWDCGAFSTRTLQALVAGRHLVCSDLGERTHGRVVAHCAAGGEDLAAQMIRRGAARACPRFSQAYAHSQRYTALEADAAALGTGIMAAPPPRAGFCEPQAVQAQAQAQAARPASTATTTASPAQGCLIKGNISQNGRIYHMPGQRFYDQTVIDTRAGERWFCTESEARAAGWRRARQ